MNVLIHISYIRKSVEHLMTKSSPAFSTCPWPQNRKNQNLHACQLCTFTWASLWVQSCTRWFCNIIQILRHTRTEPLLLGTVQQLNSCWKLSHECSIHYSSSLILEHFVPIHQKNVFEGQHGQNPHKIANISAVLIAPRNFTDHETMLYFFTLTAEISKHQLLCLKGHISDYQAQ